MACLSDLLEVPVARVQEPAAAAERVASTFEVSLITNGVTWFLRSSIAVGPRRMWVTTPRTVLGLIPLGALRFDVDLAALRVLAVGTRFHLHRLVVATLLGLLALLGHFGAIATVGLAVGAVAMGLLSFIAVLRIDEAGHPTRIIPVCLAHIPRACRLIADVASQVAAVRRSGETP